MLLFLWGFPNYNLALDVYCEVKTSSALTERPFSTRCYRNCSHVPPSCDIAEQSTVTLQQAAIWVTLSAARRAAWNSTTKCHTGKSSLASQPGSITVCYITAMRVSVAMVSPHLSRKHVLVFLQCLLLWLSALTSGTSSASGRVKVKEPVIT